MSQPILCFDLDGTLVDAAGRIHPNDVKLLAAERPPALFIPCTGRPLDSVRRTFAQNGLFSAVNVPFPLVLQNGSLILGEREARLAYLPFDDTLQKELIDCAGEFPQLTFLFLSEQETHRLGAHPFGLAAARKFEFTPSPFGADSQETAFSKVMCISQSALALAAVARRVEALPVEADYSMPTIFEITPKAVNKGLGVKRLLRLLQRDGDPFWAAGDGENDLALFSFAARSFAPRTAPEAIRQIVSHVVDVPRKGLLAPMLAVVQHEIG
jgi:HAD superfamily hydrolase (TIGR01484 family)